MMTFLQVGMTKYLAKTHRRQPDNHLKMPPPPLFEKHARHHMSTTVNHTPVPSVLLLLIGLQQAVLLIAKADCWVTV